MITDNELTTLLRADIAAAKNPHQWCKAKKVTSGNVFNVLSGMKLPSQAIGAAICYKPVRMWVKIN